MRSDLSPAIAAAIERCERPTLAFDLARIERNAIALRDAARAAGVTLLFAAKSFPHAGVRDLIAQHVDGFDVASPAELAELPAARVISIADPSGRTSAPPAGRAIVSCETVEQVRAASPHAEIAIRISASLTNRDPAVGAVESSGHHRSRFGLDLDPARRGAALRELVAAAAGRPVGLHVHHGPFTATSGERFVATAKAVLAAAADTELVPRFINLGGAWHGIADVASTLRELRAAVPREIELIVEPGRAFVDGAGFACGRVMVARELDDRSLRVIDLSRICHLRWSQVELVAQAPRPGHGRDVLLVGPTCFEEDAIGDWKLEEALATGARVIFRNVSGYAVAWNCGFHGVSPADVIVVR